MKQRDFDPKVKKYKWSETKVDYISYMTLHNRIKKQLKKPDACVNCKKNKILDLANISGEYKTDITDWTWLCRKCHLTYDWRNRRLKVLNTGAFIL